MRDAAIFRVLIDTGMRRGELASVNVADIDWDESTITVLEKGRRVRQVPFGDKTAVALDKYQVVATSEGDLWEAWIEGINEWDAALRKMAPP